jgi:hypothetical protein
VLLPTYRCSYAISGISYMAICWCSSYTMFSVLDEGEYFRYLAQLVNKQSYVVILIFEWVYGVLFVK